MCSKCKTGRGRDVILGPKTRVKAAPKPALNHREARIAAFKAAQRQAGTLAKDKPVKPVATNSEPRKRTVRKPVKVDIVAEYQAKIDAHIAWLNSPEYVPIPKEPLFDYRIANRTCTVCRKDSMMPKGQIECGSCRNAR
jgi:hypothetical protein